ncbi:MAG: IS4 family transposase [Rikenellaceae bacterium]
MKSKIKDSNKGNNLTQILQQYIGKNINLARIKFIALLLEALCRMQSVSMPKLALCFGGDRSSASSHRRIERFFAAYDLPINLIAKLIVSLLPTKPPFTLAMDRTHWKSATTDMNVLTLAICYRGVAFPVLFTMLPKAGNSSSAERIELMERFKALFGEDSIERLTADREFIGKDWFRYLNDSRTKYYIRIKEGQYVTDPRKRSKIKVGHLFNSVRNGEFRSFEKLYYVGSELCFLAASRVKNKQGVMELQIIASYNQPELSKNLYKERWLIECTFKSLKTSGFNIEATHIRDVDRFAKMLSLVMLAFVWAYLIGVYVHENIRRIRLCKHGYLAKSFVKYGLEALVAALYNYGRLCNGRGVFDFLSGS